MKRSARLSTAIVATGLVLAACGTAEEAAPATEPAATEAPAPADTEADLTPNEGSSTEGTAAAPAEEAAEEPVESAEATEAEEPAPEPVATEAPVATEPPAAPPAEAVIGGRAFAAELAPESDFADNILPDLLVDDIRSGSQVNFRNIFPADRPVLIWAWAPH